MRSYNPLLILMHILRGLEAQWALIKIMSTRAIEARYRGSLFGIAWSFFNPILMLGIYTFFFSVVVKARWDGADDAASHINFAVILFSGLVVHGFFSEMLLKAPSLIVDNVNFVKKVVFPLDIFSWVSLAESLFHLLIGTGVLLLMMALSGERLHWEIFLFPLILVPLIMISLGLSWALSALGVYFRDIKQLMSFVASALLFLSPIFYPLSALPRPLQILAMFNPLTIAVEQAREVLLYGHTPDVTLLTAYFFAGLLVLTAGYRIFLMLRRGFADVL